MSSRTPLVRQVSWPMVLPQLLAMAAFVAAVHLLIRPGRLSLSMAVGCGFYLAYSILSRQVVASAHRAGIRLTKQGRYEEAITQFERSYRLFSTRRWIDRLRCVVLMSPSAVSYREMALVNIAFCHGQLGNAELAKEHYRKALEEFPDSAMAKTSLRMIETFEKGTPESPHADGNRALPEE